MNYCVFGGHLVNAKTPLPSDPVDHDVERLPILGCNRLRCPLCNAMVRNVAGLNFKDSFPKVDVNQLYELADLTTSPLLEKRGATRLYLCRCDWWPESIASSSLQHPDADTFSTPQVAWRCDGHPLAELPHDFDGTQVTPASVGEITTRSLHGWTPPGAAPDDKWGAYWAARLYVRLGETRWQETVVGAASAVLEDPDAKARARALHFFSVLEVPEGPQRALMLLDGDRALFAGIREAITLASDKTLEEMLWRVATPLVAAPGRARDLARAEALAPGKGTSALYGALASGDPEWVAAHVEEIARATPTEVKALASAIRYRFPGRVPPKPVLERLSSLFPTKG